MDDHKHSVSIADTFRQPQLIDVVVDPEGSYIDHIYVEPSNRLLPDDPTKLQPHKVYKKRYVVDQGKIVLGKTIEGTHVPGYFVSETFEFPDA